MKKGIHESLWKNIRPNGIFFRIHDANNRSVIVGDTIDVVVNIERSVETGHFNVVEGLATRFTPVCDYCHELIQSIRPRNRIGITSAGIHHVNPSQPCIVLIETPKKVL